MEKLCRLSAIYERRAILEAAKINTIINVMNSIFNFAAQRGFAIVNSLSPVDGIVRYIQLLKKPMK